MRGLRGFVGGVVSICSNTDLTMGGSSSHPREAGAGSSMTVPTVNHQSDIPPGVVIHRLSTGPWNM